MLGRLVAVVCLALVAPGLAYAQLPFGDLETDGPEFRLASRDQLTDDAVALQLLLDKMLGDRKGEIEKARAAVSASLDDIPLSVLDEVHDPRELAQRLNQAFDRELALLAQAAEVGTKAVTEANQKVEAVGAAVGFDRLIREAVTAQRLRHAVAVQEKIARRLSGLPAIKPDAVTVNLGERLVQQEWRIQTAQAHLEQAKLLHATAKARTASSVVAAIQPKIEVSKEQVASLQSELWQTKAHAEAESRKIETERAELQSRLRAASARRVRDTGAPLREARRNLALAQFHELDVRTDALSVGLKRARVKYLAAAALERKEPLTLPPELSSIRVASEIAELEQERAVIEIADSDLRQRLQKAEVGGPMAKVLTEHRAALDASLGTITEARQHLEVVEVIAMVVNPMHHRQHTSRVPWNQILFTMLTMVLGFVVLRYGLRPAHRAFAASGPMLRALRIDEARAEKVDATLTLAWPFGVAAACAAVIIWPIWNLNVTVTEAAGLIDTPLFYVEQQRVSILSILQMIFAIWASIVTSRLVRSFLSRRVYGRFDLDIGLTNALTTLAHYVIVLTGLLIGLRFVGIGLSSLAIFAGVLGIGIGFGLRNIAENFISGLIILAERPIKIGDFIEVEGHLEGEVRHIRARSTTLVTRDNISLIVPNSEFVGGRVTNWSHGDQKVRVAIEVGIAYGSNTDLARKTLLEIAGKHGQVLKKPKPDVQFANFGDSSLEMRLFIFIDEQLHRFRIASDLRFAIDKAFRKQNIEIAFPQMDVHFKTVSAPVVAAIRPPLEGPLDLPSELPDVGRPRSLAGPVPGSTLPT